MPLPSTKTVIFLITSLRNPMRDTSACAVALLKTLGNVTIGQEKLPKTLLRAMMEFVSAQRSPDELTELRSRMSRCQCNCQNEAVKAPHPLGAMAWRLNIIEDVFLAMVDKPLMLISNHLSKLKPHRFPKLVKHGDQPWPTSLEDLCLPTGTCAGTTMGLL